MGLLDDKKQMLINALMQSQQNMLVPDLYPNSTWGTRADGTAKGTGWLGPIRMPLNINDNFIPTYITELSAGDEKGEFPIVSPYLNKMELLYLRMGNSPTKQMIDKSHDFASMLRANKLPTFKPE